MAQPGERLISSICLACLGKEGGCIHRDKKGPWIPTTNCPCYDLDACPGELDPDLTFDELNAKYGFGGCGFEGS